MKNNKKCKYYREEGVGVGLGWESGCTCNNDIENVGECVYGDGVIRGKPVCRYYEEFANTNYAETETQENKNYILITNLEAYYEMDDGIELKTIDEIISVQYFADTTVNKIIEGLYNDNKNNYSINDNDELEYASKAVNYKIIEVINEGVWITDLIKNKLM